MSEVTTCTSTLPSVARLELTTSSAAQSLALTGAIGSQIASHCTPNVIHLSFKPKIDINHIVDRHSYNTQYRDVSKFLSGMEPKDIESLILEGIEKTRAFNLEYRGKMYDRVSVVNFNRTIGYDVSGNPTSFLRIIWRNKQIHTAYPVEVL
ncbi:MAG: hypothetical protein ACFFD1_04935 [Candidatus Thorarchaeota archaeon]